MSNRSSTSYGESCYILLNRLYLCALSFTLKLFSLQYFTPGYFAFVLYRRISTTQQQGERFRRELLDKLNNKLNPLELLERKTISEENYRSWLSLSSLHQIKKIKIPKKILSRPDLLSTK